MATRSLHWQGKTRAEQLRARIESCAREWLRLWSVESARLELQVSSANLDAAPVNIGSDAWFACEVAAGTLHVRGDTDLHERLGCQLSGVSSRDGGLLAEGIGKHALADLMRSIVQPAGDGKMMAPVSVAEVEEGLQSRFGALGFVLAVGEIRCAMYLDSALCKKLVPPQAVARIELTSRRKAVMSEEVMLAATLDLGYSPLEETITLKPGDVIKTSAPLASVIRVGTEPGSVAFSGVLVADGMGRALRCVETFFGKGEKR
jgi:hypothetical protein